MSSAASFTMSSVLSSSTLLCVASSLPPYGSTLTVVSSGTSSLAVVWLFPSVVPSVPSFTPMMSAPTQSFSQPWCPPCPSVSSSASLIPPSSFVSHSSAPSVSLAPPPPVTTVSVPSAEVSSGVGFSLTLGGRVRHLPVLFLPLTRACQMRHAFSPIPWSSGMATSRLPRVRILMLLVNQSLALHLRKSFP